VYSAIFSQVSGFQLPFPTRGGATSLTRDVAVASFDESDIAAMRLLNFSSVCQPVFLTSNQDLMTLAVGEPNIPAIRGKVSGTIGQRP
jgi:hypothetical protein